MSKTRTYSFSLLTLLLLTTIVALVISHFAKERRYRELDAEIQVCREKFGYVKIGDPSLVYISPFKEQGKHKQLYRLYMPPGHFHMLNIAEISLDPKDRPVDPVPTRSIALHTWKQGADSVLEFSMTTDSKGAYHCQIFENGIEHLNYKLKAKPTNNYPNSSSQLDTEKVTTYRPDDRIEFMTFEMGDTKKGIVVWLEPYGIWEERQQKQEAEKKEKAKE